MSNQEFVEKPQKTPASDGSNKDVGPSKPPVEDKFQDKVANYIHEALNKHDSNGDERLSPEEFQEARKQQNKTVDDRKVAAFIAKHFGALTLLNTDSTFSEAGISRADALNLHGNSLNHARASYLEKYPLGNMLGFSGNYFDTNHAPHIRRMVRDLNANNKPK